MSPRETTVSDSFTSVPTRAAVGVPDSSALAATVAVFQRWLYLPDAGALYAVLGAVAANRLQGDPVWLLLVGPPGGGKSELLTALGSLPEVHPAATLTEASLLSGTSKRETTADSSGGVLRTLGDFGIIVAKDFGSILSMNRDARAAALAALREVYDGSWTRHVGTDGGRTLHWSGKVGLVGGCTPTIDRHHAVMGAMGERFLLYRLPEVDPATQAREALKHAGREKIMRSELADAVVSLMADAGQQPRPLSATETDGLVSLATLVVRARSAVERDGYSREIDLIPPPEAPTRLVVVLERLLAGLDAIGLARELAWPVVQKAALDSVPALRLAALEYLAAQATADTNTIATAVRYPAVTTRRALEDLTAHALASCTPQPGKALLWTLTDFAATRLRRFPEKSSNTRNEIDKENKTLHTATDISGTREPEDS